jgi:AdoMet-dependent heme synthase
MSHWNELFVRAARQAIPIEVMIELTHHCNFRCEHCYIPDFTAPDLLPTGRVLDLLEELAAMGTLVLALSGGELFLRRDWHAIASQARRLGFDLHLFTNGSRIGVVEAAAIAALDATVHVSFYSRDEARFDRFTAHAGSFREVVGGIERLLAAAVKTILKVPLMTWNLGEAKEISEWAAAIGAECRLSPFITAKKDGDTGPLALRVLHEELVRELGGPVLGCHDAGDRPERDPEAPLCAAASRYACITPAGDVMACNILPGADGNIRARSFRDVWESSAWLGRIRALRPRDLPVCSTCSRLSYCGRCTAQALVEDGDLVGPSRHAQQRADFIDAARSFG